jgi:hypothetical protein
MAHEPIIAATELPSAIHADAPGVEQPAPPADRQQVADDLFSGAAKALIGLQAGVVAAGLIVDNITEVELPKKVPPRLPPETK